MYFRVFLGRPHLDNPRTFNQKVNWRVLNDRRAVIAMTGDKLAMKAYARRTCPQVRIPRTLWTGTDLAELTAVDLPAQWVLKPNHGTQRVYIGAGRPDPRALRLETAGWLDESMYDVTCEWAYTQGRRLLLLEEFIGGGDEVPADYKLHVFDGEVRAIAVDTARFGDHQRRIYDGDWRPLPYLHGRTTTLAPVTAPPPSLDAMKSIATALAGDLDFVRVDLYDVDGEIWFGEMTASPAAGLDRFTPRGLDAELGRHWRLPSLA